MWLESEEDCNSFILEKQDFNYDPQKANYWLEQSNIDFSKFGWTTKLSNLWKVSSNKAGCYVRKHFPQFYEEKCFKRGK